MTMKSPSFLLAAVLLAASWLTLGCASNGAGSSSEPTASRSSGVEVFGVIDVGVSRTTTKSGR